MGVSGKARLVALVFLMVVLDSGGGIVHLPYLEQLVEILKPLIGKVVFFPDYGFSFPFFPIIIHLKDFVEKRNLIIIIFSFNFIDNFVSEHKYIYLVVINIHVLFCVQFFSVNVFPIEFYVFPLKVFVIPLCCCIPVVGPLDCLLNGATTCGPNFFFF